MTLQNIPHYARHVIMWDICAEVLVMPISVEQDLKTKNCQFEHFSLDLQVFSLHQLPDKHLLFSQK